MGECGFPIGIIDSGVGGISVLMELRKILPRENFVYLSDTENAPYGTKSESEIKALTSLSVKRLMAFPCKVVVIACNTATAVSVEMLRKEYGDERIVGLEPAIIPAARDFPGENILVLTTEATEKTVRFKKLVSFAAEKSNIICLPVQKVVSFVESGMADSPALISYLRSVFSVCKGVRFSAVVLGCTHFPFAKNAIEKALGYCPMFYDGSKGAAKRVKALLSGSRKLNVSDDFGSVTWVEKGFSVYAREMLRRTNYV